MKIAALKLTWCSLNFIYYTLLADALHIHYPVLKFKPKTLVLWETTSTS